MVTAADVRSCPLTPTRQKRYLAPGRRGDVRPLYRSSPVKSRYAQPCNSRQAANPRPPSMLVPSAIGIETATASQLPARIGGILATGIPTATNVPARPFTKPCHGVSGREIRPRNVPSRARISATLVCDVAVKVASVAVCPACATSGLSALATSSLFSRRRFFFGSASHDSELPGNYEPFAVRARHLSKKVLHLDA